MNKFAQLVNKDISLELRQVVLVTNDAVAFGDGLAKGCFQMVNSNALRISTEGQLKIESSDRLRLEGVRAALREICRFVWNS